MTLEAHSPSLPPASAPSALPPASGRTLWTRLLGEPNPVWMRELKQAARLQRTPIILSVVTGMMTLLICSVGGVASTTAEPAKVGVGIFHTFFSLAYAVVTWLGPAVAANTIAGERSGRTWEALQLTGLGPRRIARGKFLAAYTYICLYVVMLVPVGALPFLFGGVTATEVLLAFLILFLLAALAVAFGLSVSAKFQSPAAAIIVTLLVALPVSLAVYGGAGVGLSYAAHDLWPGVPGGPPVWLPTAYVRADFGLPYCVFLLLLPALSALIPAWLFYESAVANMGSPSDDRSTRLRVWFVTAMPTLTACIALVTWLSHDLSWVYAGAAFLWSFGCFGAFLFSSEPFEPSLRVLADWQRRGTSMLARSFGPGIVRACVLLLLVTAGCLVATAGLGVLKAKTNADRDAVLAFHGYALAFFGFVVGFTAWARARATSAGTPRLLLATALFFAFVGPWIAMAVAGIITSQHDRAMLMASPSPSFAVTMAQAASTAAPDAGLILATGSACAAAWALIGVGLFAVAGVRVRTRLAAEHSARAALQQAFEAEEAAHRASPAEPINEV
ncbi:MAG TPA: ABC transporter permease [Polyangiaceae bacterium]|nr:ABC transporter permease [Polyangiaceae bacterium]